MAFTVVLALPVLLGMSAFVVDVGTWYLADRKMQAMADAGALAGVQELPYDVNKARTVAVDFTTRNGNDTPTVSFPTTDTIEVVSQRQAPKFFSAIFGGGDVTVSATARASVGRPTNVRYAAPIVVSSTQEKLDTTKGCPCFNQQTTISLGDEERAGSGTFGLADIGLVGNPGASTLSTWIRSGLDRGMSENLWYPAVTGEKIGQIRAALEETIGRALFFPVYDLSDDVAKSYHVIAWAAFVIDPGGVKWTGASRTLTGRFVPAVATGDFEPGDNVYGVRVVALTG